MIILFCLIAVYSPILLVSYIKYKNPQGRLHPQLKQNWAESDLHETNISEIQTSTIHSMKAATYFI